jgi:hypothetical protein
MLAVPPKPAPVPLPRDEALATVAHELRDPLNTILLALELHSVFTARLPAGSRGCRTSPPPCPTGAP